MRALRDFFRGNLVAIVVLSTHPLSEGGSWLGPCSGVETNDVRRSEAGRPFTFQLVGWQMLVCQGEAFPIRLHRIHFSGCEWARSVVEVVRDFQLAHIQRSGILRPFTKRHIGPLPRHLNELGVFAARLYAIVAPLRTSVWVPVKSASQLPWSFRAVF